MIDELLSRGVGEFIDPDGKFRTNLETNPEKVVIKFGVDPTRPDLHLGHAVVLRKLRQFQDLGCKVVFLIGDYTGQIGDPTGKNVVRPEVDFMEIEKNMKTYLTQVGKILREDPAVFSWIRNSDWFTSVSDVMPGPDSKTTIEIQEEDTKKVIEIAPDSFLGKAILLDNSRMQKTQLQNNQIQSISLSGVLRTLRHITHSRLIARDMFKDRLSKGEELYMHEMLYPVLQGLDSHVLEKVYNSCDLEIGGTDQTFNMLIGRDVMKMYGQKEQSVMSIKILEGLDGKEKMSKSLDNYVGITDEPSDMYGKIMSIPDSSIVNYFELCTFSSMSEVENIRNGLTNNSLHPKEVKMSLAKQIVSIYHGEQEAMKAEENFINTFQKNEIPTDIEAISVEPDTLLVDAFLSTGIVSSKSDFRRLVDENAITYLDTDEKISSHTALATSGVYRIGKKRFCKIK